MPGLLWGCCFLFVTSKKSAFFHSQLYLRNAVLWTVRNQNDDFCKVVSCPPGISFPLLGVGALPLLRMYNFWTGPHLQLQCKSEVVMEC